MKNFARNSIGIYTKQYNIQTVCKRFSFEPWYIGIAGIILRFEKLNFKKIDYNRLYNNDHNANYILCQQQAVNSKVYSASGAANRDCV